MLRRATGEVPGPAGRPSLDELRSLRDGPHEFLLHVGLDYGPVVRYPAGPVTFYLACHPDAVKRVLVDNHKAYGKGTFQYRLLENVTGQGLLVSEGDLWLRQRRLAQPAFHRDRLAAFDTLMTRAVGDVLDGWERHARRNEPVDVAEAMMGMALTVVGTTLFDAEMARRADDLTAATLAVLDHLVHRARTFGVIPDFLPTPGNRRFKAALRVLDGAVYETIGRQGREGGRTAENLLTRLADARDEDTGEGMSDRQLRDEVITMIIAGHETVASALAWTWYLLSEHPDVEERLYAEVRDVLGDRAPTADDLPRLTYTERVFKEALRLYPPAWIVTRKALADDELSGYPVPAGALVVTSPYVTHRLPDYWEDAERFDPDRFSPERQQARPRFAYYPFGGGPRLCIGDRFATMEGALVIASVVQRYRLVLEPGHVVEAEPGVTLRPRKGLPMRPIPR